MRHKQFSTGKERKHDLDRLAFLEQLNKRSLKKERKPTGEPGEEQQSIIFAGPRYGRFRHVADMIIALSILSVLWGAVAIGLEIAQLVADNISIVGGIKRILMWLIATTTAYGVLKAIGEALFIWSDIAEICNTGIELSLQEKQNGQYKYVPQKDNADLH